MLESGHNEQSHGPRVEVVVVVEAPQIVSTHPKPRNNKVLSENRARPATLQTQLAMTVAGNGHVENMITPLLA